MNAYLLGVDCETGRCNMYRDAFAARGIILEIVLSMQEAVAQCTRKPYMAIGINAETVDYRAQLPILRDAIYAPLHIFTTKMTDAEELLVYRLRADMYAEWRDDPELHATFSLLHFERQIQRSGEPKAPIKFINYKCLRMYPDYRKAVIGDKALHLNRKEYDILYNLMNNRGKPLTFKQIYRRVWKDEYGDDRYDAILTQVQRLRKKLYYNPELYGCIENVREIGYRFLPIFD